MRNMLSVFTLNLPDAFWRSRLQSKRDLFFEVDLLENETDPVDWQVLWLGLMDLLCAKWYNSSGLTHRERLVGLIKGIIANFNKFERDILLGDIITGYLVLSCFGISSYGTLVHAQRRKIKCKERVVKGTLGLTMFQMLNKQSPMHACLPFVCLLQTEPFVCYLIEQCLDGFIGVYRPLHF
ncbi:hypothetical protein ACN38_g12913 [Penicillium nordicum]|uniref:Uncharacterized protein n=1 Tax=Penicillium nordicum TaxID=229535 RepID=A0A0M8NWK2_9EURO|nr:hypothetical protein ACN38_g12913 [Penicillium nordicum]